MIDTVVVLVIGVIIGAVLVRYGIGLGTKIIYQVKEDLPILGKDMKPTDQAYSDGTTDEELEELAEKQ